MCYDTIIITIMEAPARSRLLRRRLELGRRLAQRVRSATRDSNIAEPSNTVWQDTAEVRGVIMFTKRLLSLALLLLTLTVSVLMTSTESRAYGYYRTYYRTWGRHRVVYVYRRPYYRRYYNVFTVRRHRWHRHPRAVYIYGRPYYRRYR